MNFQETVMGKRFFEVQMPKLTEVLEDIAKALSEKGTSVQLPVDVPENYLEELYYGNLGIGAASMEGFSVQGMKEIISIQDELQEQMTPEQWQLFLKYDKLMGNYCAKEACRLFQNGFRLAVKLIMAGLNPPRK